MENNKNNFVKVGNEVFYKPALSGNICSLEPNKVYSLKVDTYTDEISFVIMSDLHLPKKIYNTKKEEMFVNKVLNQFKTQDKGNLGVMLNGIKGSGKTITAKLIANKSNLPIVLIDKAFNPRLFKNLFNILKDINVCIIFDEIDKINSKDSRYYDDTFLLTVLDGINTTGKNLILFTCNDGENINKYMIDRCSRIRYWVTFKELSVSMIQTVLQDKMNDKNRIKSVADFITKNLKYITFDNIIAFVEEVNNYPNEQLSDLFDDMNLSKR